MRQKHFFGLAVLAVMLVASSFTFGQDVHANYMPGIDWSQYHTYKWVAIAGGERPNQIVDSQIKQAIDAQLAEKGLTKTEGEQADLDIAYQVAISKQTQWNAYNTGGIGWGWGGGMATATSSTINVGSLVLDMYDQSKKELVWSGTATKTLNPSKDQEKNQERLNKTAKKLLKDFPPKEK